jgi:hypothetical protein
VFLLVSNCRQWVVDAVPYRRPHACGGELYKFSLLKNQSADP